MRHQSPSELKRNELLENYRELQQEERDRISAEIIYGRKKQQSPPINVQMEQLKAKGMLQEAQNRDFFNMITFMNFLKENGRSQGIDVKKLGEELSEIFTEETDGGREDQEWVESLKIVGDIYQKPKPNTILVDTSIKIDEKNKRKQEHDEKIVLDFLFTILDRRKKKHPAIEELEKQGQKIRDNFFKYV